MIWYGIAGCGVVLYGMIRTVWYNNILNDMISYNHMLQSYRMSDNVSSKYFALAFGKRKLHDIYLYHARWTTFDNTRHRCLATICCLRTVFIV